MITYIDMDGVLADFYWGAHKWMGYSGQNFSYKTQWDWPIELGFEFWKVPCHFWENLPLCKDAYKWFELAEGRKIIATSPCGLESLAGKKLWVEHYFPDLEIIFIMDKSLLAGSNRILIDDNPKQINKFKEFGGTGILVPRPWNFDSTNSVKETKQNG